MAWIRRNLMTIIVLVAIVVSFLVARDERIRAQEQERLDNVASCVRANTRSALGTSFQRQFASAIADQAGQSKKNLEIARDFAANARGGISYLAIAAFSDHPENATRVHEVTINGKEARILTPHAERLIISGCAQAFHADEVPRSYPALGLRSDPMPDGSEDHSVVPAPPVR